MKQTTPKERDLGTYHVKVYTDRGSFVMEWNTGGRFAGGGSAGCWPIESAWIGPIYEDESDLSNSIEFMFTEGNYGCDCNMGNFIARAYQKEDPDMECGDTIKLQKLILVRPDGTEKTLLSTPPQTHTEEGR